MKHARALFAFALLCALCPPARAQERDEHGRNAAAILRTLRPVTAPLSASVATMLSDDAPVAMATVVAREGLLVSKASELTGILSCSFADGRTLPARIVARDAGFDLVLLAVAAKDLSPVTWSAAPLEVGRLVVSAGAGGTPLALGVVGVAARTIEGGRARLGVVLAFGDSAATVARVTPDSAAATSGVRVGDRILSVDGVLVADREEAARAIRRRRAGQSVRLVLGRGDATVPATLSLGRATTRRLARTSEMDGQQSQVRRGFPNALQHDTVLSPRQCGAPLVGLDGAAVGLNIARAGRVATYAIPGAEMARIVQRLRASAGASRATERRRSPR